MTTTASFEQEKALRQRGIIAEIIHDGSDRVLVSLSTDALDDLIDGYITEDGMYERISEAESLAYEIGHDAGEEYGYESACDDIKSEEGAAWEIVAPLLTEAREAGYQAACDDIAGLEES